MALAQGGRLVAKPSQLWRCTSRPSGYFSAMTRLQELELQAGKLPEAERAALVSRLLATLPPVLADTDGGVAEARRRDAELDANPAAGLSDKQFRAAIAASREAFWVHPANAELNRSGD